ncbi:hypothetical protein ACLOJK_023085, partial [Asimina triloba]
RRVSSSKDHDHVAKESKDNAVEKPKETAEGSKEALPQDASISHRRGGHSNRSYQHLRKSSFKP